MLEFREIELSDKDWINELLSRSDFMGSEYTFANNFAWRKIYNTKICRYKDFYLVHTNFRRPSFMFPVGEGDLHEVIEQMRKYADANGFPLVIHSMNKKSLELLEEIYPNSLTTSTNRDDYDYIYNTSDIITLKGKKYHSKRNHINRFKDNDWSFEPITEENIEECSDMNNEWCRQNDCNSDESKKQEFCAVKQMFKNFFELGCKGALLRLDGKVVAFTIGEPLNSDTYIIHVEKAFSDVQGAYPTINREFAEYAASDFAYINREDDAGSEGLRKAKLSYNPAFMLEKYWVEFND